MSQNISKQEELKPFVAPIMARFSCNEDMAYTIIRSAEKSGEMGAIRKMCSNMNRRNKNHA